MHRIKEILVLLLLLLLAMPAETFAQSAGGQISRKSKTAARKNVAKKTPSKSTTKKPAARRSSSESSPQLQLAPKLVFSAYSVSTMSDRILADSTPTSDTVNFTETVNGVSFNMIAVKGGTFTMGATSEQGGSAGSDEKPAHKVTLSDYHIGETEVTQELWLAVMGSYPSDFTGNLQRPVESVSWNDCQEFIKKLNQLTGKTFRLPTEAEWEYAARGGNKSRGYKYAGSNTIGDVAWYGSNSEKTTHPVKQKQANELGIYDMSGNVREWCQDWFGDYSSSPQTNPTGPSSGSDGVLRGGSWIFDAWHCRVSIRIYYNPAFRNNYGGLRLSL